METQSRREESKRATNNEMSAKTKVHRSSNRLGVKYKRRPTAGRLIGNIKAVKTPYSTPLDIQSKLNNLKSDDIIYKESNKLLARLIEVCGNRVSSRRSNSASQRAIKKQPSNMKIKSKRSTKDTYVEDFEDDAPEKRGRKQKLSLAKTRTTKRASSRRTPRSILHIPSEFCLTDSGTQLLKRLISDCYNNKDAHEKADNLTVVFHLIINLAAYSQYIPQLSDLASSVLMGIKSFNSNPRVAWFGFSILEKIAPESFMDRQTVENFYLKIEEIVSLAMEKHIKLVSLLCIAQKLFWVISEWKDLTPRVFKRSTMKNLAIAMSLYPNNHEIQLFSCFLLQRLSVDGRNEEIFGRVNGIRLILNAALNTSLEKETVRKACAALWNLSFSEKNKEKMLSMEAHLKIAKIIRMHSTEKISTRRPDVVSKALGSIWNLADYADAKSILIRHKIPELVVATMAIFRFDDKVQEMGCGCLRSLAYDDTSRIGLMKIGASEKILESMKDHIKHQGIQYQAFAVLKKLSCNDTNEGRLIRMHAGERILEAMDAHLNVASIQERACGVLWNLAVNDDHKVKLVTIGCAEKMLEAMEVHIDVEQVQFQTCRTLKRLARDSNNEVHLMRLGAAKHVLKAMDRHMAIETIQEKGCGVLWNLSERDEHKRELMKLGAAEQILKSMTHHIKVDNVQYEACGALKRLAVDDEIEVKLMEMNAAANVLRAMQHHLGVADVQGQACGVLWNLAFNGQAQLMKLNAADQILMAMEKHKDNESVQEKACGTLWKLAEVEDNNETLIKLGVIDKVLAAMDNIKTHAGVQYQACGTLWNLAVKESNRKALLAARAEDRVLNVMAQHRGRADILHSACGVLFNLAQTPIMVQKSCSDKIIPPERMTSHEMYQNMNENLGKTVHVRDRVATVSNRVLLANKGAVVRLIQCIRAHSSNFDVFYQAIAALNHIAQDPKAVIAFLEDPSILQEVVHASDMHMEDNGVPENAAVMLSRLLQAIDILSKGENLQTLVAPQTDKVIQKFINNGLAKMLSISRTHMHSAIFQRTTLSFFFFAYKILSRNEKELCSRQEHVPVQKLQTHRQISSSSSFTLKARNSFFEEHIRKKSSTNSQDPGLVIRKRLEQAIKRAIAILPHNLAEEKTKLLAVTLMKRILQDSLQFPDNEFFASAAATVLNGEGVIPSLLPLVRGSKLKLQIPSLWVLRLITYRSSSSALRPHMEQRLIGHLFEKLFDCHGKTNEYKMLLLITIQQLLSKYDGALESQVDPDRMIVVICGFFQALSPLALAGNDEATNLLRCICTLMSVKKECMKSFYDSLIRLNSLNVLLDLLRIARCHSKNFDLCVHVLNVLVGLTTFHTIIYEVIKVNQFTLILEVLIEMHGLLLHQQFGYLKDPRQNILSQRNSRARDKKSSWKVTPNLSNENLLSVPLPKTYSVAVNDTIFTENMCNVFIKLCGAGQKFSGDFRDIFQHNKDLTSQLKFVKSLYTKGLGKRNLSMLGGKALKAVMGETEV